MNFSRKIFVIATIFISIISKVYTINCNKIPTNIESQLKKYLFCDSRYDRLIRPANSITNVTIVNLYIILKNFEFYDSAQRLEAHAWLPMNYIDENLQWSPAQYNNIQAIYVSSKLIWMPDIYLHNSNIGRNSDICSDTECILNSSGMVACVLPCSLNALCESNFKRWPFDRQNCTLSLGTWLTPSTAIDFNISHTMSSTTHALEHNEWKIISTSFQSEAAVVRNVSYPSVKFRIAIERHSNRHMAVIFVPTVVMILINIISLLIDLNSSDRILLYAMNLFIHFGYLQQLSWYIPKNGADCPIVILYFRDSLMITATLLLLTILLRVVHSLQIRLPIWIESINRFIISSPIGGFFIISIPSLIEANEEVHNLVSMNDLKTGDNIKWQQFAKIIDRIFLIISTVIYSFMMIFLIPESYDNNLGGDEIKSVK